MHDLEANCLRTVKRPSRESGSPKYPNEKCTIFKMRTYPGPDRYTQVRPRRYTQAHAGTRRGCTSALSHPIPGYPCQLFCLSTVAISIGLALFFLGGIHRLKTRNLSCPVPLSAVVMPIRCGKCYAEMVSTVPGRFPSCPFCHFEDTAPADVRHQSLVSLGGLPSCWLAKVVQAVQPGAKGVFDEIGVLPSTVAHCLKDDFRDFLDPQQYQKSQKHGFHHIRYSNDLRHKALEVYGTFAEQNPRARISFIDSVLQDQQGPDALSHLLSISPHVEQHKLHEFLITQKRRAVRMRRFLEDNDTWRLGIHGVDIPYHAANVVPHHVLKPILESEAQELMMALPEFTRNLGVVFLTSVTGSLVDYEEITLLKHAREDAFHGCMITLPVKSKLASAIFSGPTSKDDLETIVRHIRTLFNQDGWQEVRCPGDRGRPHYWCNRIFPPMTCRTRPVLAVDGVVCCEGLVWHRTFHNHAGRDYWGTNPGIGFCRTSWTQPRGKVTIPIPLPPSLFRDNLDNSCLQ